MSGSLVKCPGCDGEGVVPAGSPIEAATVAAYRRIAVQLHASDDLEVEDDAAVSVADDGSGAWVQVWVHVSVFDPGVA